MVGIVEQTEKVVTPKSILLPYQRQWVDDKNRFKIGVWARQTGKSFSTAEEAVEDCEMDAGTMWVTLSAGERQALEWMEKARQWAEAYALVIADYTEDRDGPETLMKSAEIRWGNGSRSLALPANPKTARGYSANIVLDEFGHHEDPDAIWRAMYPSITNPLKREYKLRVVGTFNGKNNKLYYLWERAKEGKIPYSAHMVTIYDAVADGLSLDIERLRDGLDDEEGWAQEYECEPMDGSNVLLPYDLIALAESADATEFGDPERMRAPEGERYCGIDFGRQNDPTVCWTLERVADLLITREVLMLSKVSTPDQNAILYERIKAATRSCEDYTGPGIGLGDEMVRDHGEWNPGKHEFGKVELCTFTQKFKRSIFPNLRRGFEAPTRLRVPISRAVREDLHAMQQTVKNGEYSYWAPRTREGHSDRCTALALAVRAAGDDEGEDGMW